MNLFIELLFTNPTYFFSWIVFVVFSVCLHECMHAYVAYKQGDDTAKKLGHLSLNPLKQMGVFSLVMLLFLGLCWGSVPVNRGKLRHKYSNLLVSLAGPFTNLFLGLFFATIVVVLLKFNIDNKLLFMAFGNGAVMNMVLFIFNMLPIANFDGFAIVEQFVDTKKFLGSEFGKGSTMVIFILVFMFIDEIFRVSYFVFGKYVGLFI